MGLGEVGGSRADAGETLEGSELMLSAGRPCPGDRGALSVRALRGKASLCGWEQGQLLDPA